jgi:hypothetical protein
MSNLQLPPDFTHGDWFINDDGELQNKESLCFSREGEDIYQLVASLYHAQKQSGKAALIKELRYVDVVFDSPPSESCGFVEVENPNRQSMHIGEWLRRDDGYWVLRIPVGSAGVVSQEVDAMREEIRLEGNRDCLSGFDCAVSIMRKLEPVEVRPAEKQSGDEHPLLTLSVFPSEYKRAVAGYVVTNEAGVSHCPFCENLLQDVDDTCTECGAALFTSKSQYIELWLAPPQPTTKLTIKEPEGFVVTRGMWDGNRSPWCVPCESFDCPHAKACADMSPRVMIVVEETE